MSKPCPPYSNNAAPKAQRRETREVRCNAILDAALKEFTGKGFAAARMEDIARRAHVSKGTIYLYFKDKKTLFQGVLEAEFAPFFMRCREIIRDTSLPLREKLQQMYAPMTDAADPSPLRNVICLVFSEGLHTPDLVSNFYQAIIVPYVDRLREDLLPATQNESVREALLRFPLLLTAPALCGVICKELYGNSLNTKGMFDAHLDILFPPCS